MHCVLRENQYIYGRLHRSILREQPIMSYYTESPLLVDENNAYSYPFPYGFVTPVYYNPYTYPITPLSQPSQCPQPGPLTASPAVLFSQPESVYPESGCLSADSLRPSPTPMYQSPIPVYPSPAPLYPSPAPSSTAVMLQPAYELPAQQHQSGPDPLAQRRDPSSQYEQYSAPPKAEPPAKKRSRTAQACEKCRIRKAKVSAELQSEDVTYPSAPVPRPATDVSSRNFLASMLPRTGSGTRPQKPRSRNPPAGAASRLLLRRWV